MFSALAHTHTHAHTHTVAHPLEIIMEVLSRHLETFVVVGEHPQYQEEFHDIILVALESGLEPIIMCRCVNFKAPAFVYTYYSNAVIII